MAGYLTTPDGEKAAPLQAVGLALLLLVVVVLIYREAPGNQFHFDDYQNIVNHGPVRMQQLSVAALHDAITRPKLHYRHVPSLTFAIDWWRGGGEPWAFLQTNVLLHALTALAVFAFACQVLLRIRPGNHRIVLLAGFGVALLWALHPINSQAVNLIVQRMAILATLFMLLSLSCYLAARSADSLRASAWYAAAALFALLGAFSKENAWILPLLVIAIEYGVVRHGQALVRNKADIVVLALPFGAAALVALDLALGSGPISNNFLSGYQVRSFSMEERLLTQPRVFFFYLSLLLWPLPGRFSLEHDFAVSTAVTSPPSTLLALLTLAMLLLAALYLFSRPKTRVFGFLLLWPAMTLAIESSFIPLELVFEHRMYMPSVGLALLPGMAFISLRDHRPAYLIACAAAFIAVALALGASTAERTRLWLDPLVLNEDAIKKAPNSSRAWSNLGMYRYLGGDQAGAIAALEKSIELSAGREKKAFEHLGVIYLDLGDLERAETLIERAYRLQWENPEPSVLNHMGEVELARKRYASAVGFFDRAILMAPWKSTYYWNIALAQEGLANCSQALQNWRRYLELEPDRDSRLEVERHIAENHGPGGRSCGGDKNGLP
jgi:tetratricopeptide (TPR) repeat protein